VLFGAVGLVLLVACVNFAGLSLSRTVARHREVAIRTALGSSRWRVFRSFLIEALALSIAGGIAGVFVGRWSLAAFVAALPPRTLPAEAIASLDLRALLFTGAVAVLVGLISGTLPAPSQRLFLLNQLRRHLYLMMVYHHTADAQRQTSH
jgi:putative ABC transport system permease protein